jgi:hypothetical protein
MYGGNANFHNIGLYECGAVLDFLEQTAAAESWVIPSVGPDFGKLLDQARVLRTRAFPTAMVLPQTFPATPDGCEKAIRIGSAHASSIRAAAQALLAHDKGLQ